MRTYPTPRSPLSMVLLFATLCFILMAFPSRAFSSARGVVLSDQELDKVFARGLIFNFRTNFAQRLGQLNFVFRLRGSVRPAQNSEPFAVNISIGGPNPIVSVQAGGSGEAGAPSASFTVSSPFEGIADVTVNADGEGEAGLVVQVGGGDPPGGTGAQSLVEVNAVNTVVYLGLDLIIQGIQGIGSGLGSIIRSALSGAP